MIVLPNLSHALVWPVYALAIFVAIAVWLFGGKPERRGFEILLLMLAVQLIVHAIVGPPRYEDLDLSAVSADAIGLIGFTALMWYADRDYWTIVAFALALSSLLGHFARVSTEMIGFSYASFQSAPTVGILLLLPLATAAHQYRLRRFGSDRDWVPLRRYADFRRLIDDLSDI